MFGFSDHFIVRQYELFHQVLPPHPLFFVVQEYFKDFQFIGSLFC